MNAIRSVCNNPGFYDREEPGNNKRYICFNIPQGFYLIIVFTKKGVKGAIHPRWRDFPPP